MVWLKNILKYQDASLRKYKDLGQGGKGRSLMLKIYSSLQFYDQSLKKMYQAYFFLNLLLELMRTTI